MALYKEIRQNDGVTTAYHRVLFIMQTINKQNSIAVISYVDSESRDSEKGSTNTQAYKKSITYETDYDPTMTVERAYVFLKNLPEFEGAVDV